MLKTFEYVHKKMGIPLESIAKVPEVLTCRFFRIRQRHEFLVALGRAQYDAKAPNYVSLEMLFSGDDSQFAVSVAKSSVQAYNAFLKTL